MKLEEWAAKGEMVSVLNTEVFVIDEGKSDTTLVILHGYATSSIDYYKVLPELSKHFRIIIQDFIGFGFSEKPKESYFNILEQADITLELWRILKLKNITLLSHNYGTQIALEIVTRQRTTLLNIEVQNFILLNSLISFDDRNTSEKSVDPFQEFSKKIKLMHTSFSFYEMKIKDFFFDDDSISDHEIKEKWTLINHKNGVEILDFLPNYNTESKLLWNRWYITLQKNTIPAKIISGKNDVIFNENEALSFSKKLKNSKLHHINSCGHYPMLEKPEELIKLILE